MALLLSARRGWLPDGFTELEYLESSGTQYIDTGLQTTESTEIELNAQQIYFYDNISYQWIFGALTSQVYNLALSWASPVNTYEKGLIGYVVIGNMGGIGQIAAENNDFRRQAFTVNYKSGAFIINGQNMIFTSQGSHNVLPGSTLTYLLFAISRENGIYNPNPGLRIFGYKDTTNGELRLRFIPAIRNSDGVPGMWDDVSKQFFTNAGSGTFGYRIKGAPATFTLRDPHRVAPSGVYARLSGENQLEILADTEDPTGDGWEWFANTAEAYEHFGIKQEELLTNETTND